MKDIDRKKWISDFEYIVVVLLVGLALAFRYKSSFSYTERFLFASLMLSYVWTTGLMIYAKLFFDLHFFEPITIITAIYEGVFIIKPLIDLHDDEMYEHGISVIDGGAKATLLFALGYTIFFVSYYMKHKRLSFNGTPLLENKGTRKLSLLNDQKALILLWTITYALCIVGMVSQGLSLRYIFSFGFEGERVIDENNTALLFLSNFGVTLATLWVLILDRSTSRAAKIITTALSIIYVLMRNARWLMLVFIAAPIALYFLKKRRQPQMHWVIIIFVSALAVFAWMQANRNGLHSGGSMQGWGNQGFSLKVLTKPLDSDFSTYRSFFAMVKRYPSEHDYLYGTTLLYIFVLFIPKSIWPGKPDNPIRDMIEIALNNKARRSGTAVANIGEMYANFGIVGILFGMYLAGWLAASLKEMMYVDDRGDDRLVLYSILFPLLFQWTARGNFSGNVYLTIFAVLPYLTAVVYDGIRRRSKA